MHGRTGKWPQSRSKAEREAADGSEQAEGEGLVVGPERLGGDASHRGKKGAGKEAMQAGQSDDEGRARRETQADGV